MKTVLKPGEVLEIELHGINGTFHVVYEEGNVRIVLDPCPGDASMDFETVYSKDVTPWSGSEPMLSITGLSSDDEDPIDGQEG